jgi:hypothetical protein
VTAKRTEQPKKLTPELRQLIRKIRSDRAKLAHRKDLYQKYPAPGGALVDHEA